MQRIMSVVIKLSCFEYFVKVHWIYMRIKSFLLREQSSEVKKYLFLVFFKGALLKSSNLSIFDPISSQNGRFTSHIWYDDFLFQKFIRFTDFFSDFSGFS